MVEVSHTKLDNSSVFLKSVLKLYFKHFYLKLLNSCLYKKKKSLSRHTEVYVLWCRKVKSGPLNFLLSSEGGISLPCVGFSKDSQTHQAQNTRDAASHLLQ